MSAPLPWEQPLLSGWRLLLGSRISNRYNYHLDGVQDSEEAARSFMRIEFVPLNLGEKNNKKERRDMI